MKHLTRLLQEPLLHFLGLGGLIFLFFTAVTGPNPAPTDAIVIGPERIEWLATGFQSVWKRPPSDDELSAMIDDFVREEIYYREALALGLDRDDTVVRRRLRQKMEFLTDTAADLLEPAAGELEAYLAANEQTYRSGPQLAFEQIYLGETPGPDSVTLSLSALRSGPVTEPSSLGESTLLPAQLGLSLPNAIDGVFGRSPRMASISSVSSTVCPPGCRRWKKCATPCRGTGRRRRRWRSASCTTPSCVSAMSSRYATPMP
jgi:hypothetical protein